MSRNDFIYGSVIVSVNGIKDIFRDILRLHQRQVVIGMRNLGYLIFEKRSIGRAGTNGGYFKVWQGFQTKGFGNDIQSGFGCSINSAIQMRLIGRYGRNKDDVSGFPLEHLR